MENLYVGFLGIILFVVLKEGLVLTEELKEKIRGAIGTSATARHVPSIILQIREVPRTLNGKKVEVAATRIIHGQNVPNRDSLINPGSLEQFVNFSELS